MSIGDFNHLKNLSWYTTIPLFVCAWILQDSSSVAHEFETMWGFVYIVGIYFAKVVGGLLIAYGIWLYSSAYIESQGFPFTLLFATFLLTIAAVGFGLHVLKAGSMSLPVNILWFAAIGSVAFNLYQIQSSVASESAKK